MVIGPDVLLETKLLRQGRKTLATPFKEMVAWSCRELGVPVLNVALDLLVPAMTPRLSVVLELARDEERFRAADGSGYDPAKQALVAAKFRELTAGKRGLWALRGLFVAFFSFEPTAVKDAIFAVPEARLLEMKARAHLWEISRRFPPQTNFFFYTSEELARFDCNALREEYFALVKANDELGYVTRENLPVSFDTKEHFDRQFGGSWQAYYG